ncbi:hypothetical protein CEXT_22881 [Caerostris extrusa]|uniref:Uncharacterized protein n=1 Tax=Caerostris extrusa TaxID=172846 RepID=A0AAV4VAT4_CAEEX|nr:hypothetical protein CEXT_22881 [Caerostris extrusa]
MFYLPNKRCQQLKTLQTEFQLRRLQERWMVTSKRYLHEGGKIISRKKMFPASSLQSIKILKWLCLPTQLQHGEGTPKRGEKRGSEFKLDFGLEQETRHGRVNHPGEILVDTVVHHVKVRRGSDRRQIGQAAESTKGVPGSREKPEYNSFREWTFLLPLRFLNIKNLHFFFLLNLGLFLQTPGISRGEARAYIVIVSRSKKYQ